VTRRLVQTMQVLTTSQARGGAEQLSTGRETASSLEETAASLEK
jgi:hypothetical protein